MSELWKAFVARVVYWLTPKPYVPPPAPIILAPEPPLKPGICECGHKRCHHIGGKGECVCALYGPDAAHKEWWGGCACRVFILDEDDDDEEEPETPSPEELERMYSR